MNQPVMSTGVFWGQLNCSGCILLNTGEVIGGIERREQLVDNTNVTESIVRSDTFNPQFTSGVFEHIAFIQINRFFQKHNLVRKCDCVLGVLPQKLELLQIGHDVQIGIDAVTIGCRYNQRVWRDKIKSLFESMDIVSYIGRKCFPFFFLFWPDCRNNRRRIEGRFLVQQKICYNTTATRRIELPF